MDESYAAMKLRKPAITTGLKILVRVALGISIIMVFLVLWNVLLGKTTESNSYGVYLFYSLILLSTARILQLAMPEVHEVINSVEEKEARKQDKNRNAEFRELLGHSLGLQFEEDDGYH